MLVMGMTSHRQKKNGFLQDSLFIILRVISNKQDTSKTQDKRERFSGFPQCCVDFFADENLYAFPTNKMRVTK